MGSIHLTAKILINEFSPVNLAQCFLTKTPPAPHTHLFSLSSLGNSEPLAYYYYYSLLIIISYYYYYSLLLLSCNLLNLLLFPFVMFAWSNPSVWWLNHPTMSSVLTHTWTLQEEKRNAARQTGFPLNKLNKTPRWHSAWPNNSAGFVW